MRTRVAGFGLLGFAWRTLFALVLVFATYNPARIATHEHADILRDVARSTTWRDRLSFVVRGPGWAYERHRRDAVAA